MFHEAVSLPDLLVKKPSVCAEAVSSLDEEAFCALYRATAPALQGYIRKTCGNASLAEDILQETFYRLLRADLPEMDAHQMKSYLFKIATSLLVDHWRREKREKFWQNLWHPPAMTQGGQMGDVSHALCPLSSLPNALCCGWRMWKVLTTAKLLPLWGSRKKAFACCCSGRAKIWRASWDGRMACMERHHESDHMSARRTIFPMRPGQAAGMIPQGPTSNNALIAAK